MSKCTLGKSKRLIKNAQFKSILDQRRRFYNEALTAYIAGNGLITSRLGVSVNRSFGSAVRRNKFKRLVREAFRLAQPQMPAGMDFVITPSRQLISRKDKDLNYPLIAVAMADIIAKIRQKSDEAEFTDKQ